MYIYTKATKSDPYHPSDSSQFFDNRCLPLRTVALLGLHQCPRLVVCQAAYIAICWHLFPVPYAVAGTSCKWPKWWHHSHGQSQRHQDCSKATGTGGSTLLSSMSWGCTMRHPNSWQGQSQGQWHRPELPKPLLVYVQLGLWPKLWWLLGHHGHSCRYKNVCCQLSST